MAALGMVAMLGAVSLVIDAGVYFVLQRQLQNAADAAALSAVWISPACPINPVDPMDPWLAAGCQSRYPGNPGSTPPECRVPPNSVFNSNPCSAAVYTTKANWTAALSLCQGPNLPTGTIPIKITAAPSQALNLPNVGTYVVTLSCDAPHWFARVLPGVNLTMNISVSSAAALGWRGQNGQLLGDPQPTPTTPLIARLIL
jgi:hypothetical protein